MGQEPTALARGRTLFLLCTEACSPGAPMALRARAVFPVGDTDSCSDLPPQTHLPAPHSWLLASSALHSWKGGPWAILRVTPTTFSNSHLCQSLLESWVTGPHLGVSDSLGKG